MMNEREDRQRGQDEVEQRVMRKVREEKKPRCKLVGEDGNVFAVMARASKALKASGQREKSDEMRGRVMAAQSYDEALQVIMDYVEAY